MTAACSERRGCAGRSLHDFLLCCGKRDGVDLYTVSHSVCNRCRQYLFVNGFHAPSNANATAVNRYFYSASRLCIVHVHGTCQHLRSAETSTLLVPSTRRSTLGDRSFSVAAARAWNCLLYTSPSPRDRQKSRMPSSA